MLAAADIENPDIAGFWSEVVRDFLQYDSVINSFKVEISNLRQSPNQKHKTFVRSLVSRATTIQHLNGVSEESRIVGKIFGCLIPINIHFIQLHLKAEDKLPTVKNILNAAEMVDKYPLLPPITSPDTLLAVFIASTPTNLTTNVNANGIIRILLRIQIKIVLTLFRIHRFQTGIEYLGMTVFANSRGLPVRISIVGDIHDHDHHMLRENSVHLALTKYRGDNSKTYFCL